MGLRVHEQRLGLWLLQGLVGQIRVILLPHIWFVLTALIWVEMRLICILIRHGLDEGRERVWGLFRIKSLGDKETCYRDAFHTSSKKRL